MTWRKRKLEKNALELELVATDLQRRITQKEFQNMGNNVDCSAFWGKSPATSAERASYVHNALVGHARTRGFA